MTSLPKTSGFILVLLATLTGAVEALAPQRAADVDRLAATKPDNRRDVFDLGKLGLERCSLH